MRKLVGGIVLVAGFGGLGYVATTNHAERMEDAISEGANGVSDVATLPVDVQVSGRDITATGQAMDQADLDQLRTAYQGIEGVRVVNVDGIELLPVADPFEIGFSKADDGSLGGTGVVPSYVVQAQLGSAAAELPLAAGAPEGWAQVANAGQAALGPLNSGQMSLSGRDLTLSGVANTPTEREAAIAALGPLPDGFTSDLQIDVLDDGTPLRLDLNVAESAVSGTAKLPIELDGDAAFSGFDVTQSPLAADDTDWPDAARAVTQATGSLIDGHAALDGQELTLRGQASPDGKAVAETALANLPANYTQNVQIELWDDGEPLQVAMDWDGAAATATGKLPAEFALLDPTGAAIEHTGATSYRPDVDGAFSMNANAGVAALSALNEGSLVVSDDTITLTGTAISPRVNEQIDAALADVAPATVVTRDLTFLDDGSPASWVLSYDATSGGVIDGRLPTTLEASDLQGALGVPSLVGSPGVALDDDTIGPAPEMLTIVSEYLPEVETLALTHEAGATALDVVVAPGVDVDLIAADLAERLPSDAAFTISSVSDLPQQGAFRVNAASGVGEVFLNGYWIPDLNFVTSIDGCAEQTAAQMSDGGIGFLSGSARLDATSIRTINALAAIAVPCVEADLELEVAGHTDASGNADQNQILSQDRAATVRSALIERGVPERAITSIGFGQTQPIADNDTAEGRAENRRTEFEWFERGALRNP